MNCINRSNAKSFRNLGICLGGAALLGGALAPALVAAPDMEQLAKENQDLKERMAKLETLAQQQGLVPSDASKKLVSAMSDISLSGFVQASYFYNTRTPADRKSDGYLWNTTHNSFSINKVKVTLASKPVEASGEKFDAGFRTSLIWGEDSPNLNTGSPKAGFEALREAYVEINVPLGTGLNVKAGQLISLLNYESGDGGAANQNFSQGNQWWFTGNGPAAGLQVGYTFTESVDLKVRVQNGMFAGPVDNNDGKALVASLGIKPSKKSWVNLIGWYSNENDATSVAGGSVLAGYQVTEKFGTGLEFDYFKFDGHHGGGNADLYSIGGWAWYDFTSKVGLAFRADFINSPDGVLGPAVRPGAGIITPDSDGNLGSLTLTLNLKPTANLRIQPEIRYDYTSFTGGLDGHKQRVIIGAGISYLF